MAIPSDIANLIVWLKADTGCYQDAGLTTPCTNGTSCNTWVNQAGGFNFTQAVGANQPTWYDTGGWNDRPFLTFAADWLGSTMGPYAQPITMFWVIKYTSIGGPVGCWTCSDAAAGIQLTNSPSYTSRPYIWAGASIALSNIHMDTGSPIEITTIHNGTSSLLRQNRAIGYNSTTNIGANTLTNMYLMCDAGGTYYMNGDIYELFVYDRALSQSEIDQLEEYVGVTYNLWPSSASATQPSCPTTPTCPAAIRKIMVGTENFEYGLRKENVEGNPSPPSLAVDYPNTYFRWRWGVNSGSRTLSVDAKQISNTTGKRPRIIVRANPSIGVNSDITGDAADGTGWVTIGPLAANPTSSGVLWVEMWNMDTDNNYSPAYFDHIVTT